MTHYQAAIIGSGQGGTPLAVELAKAGWKTVLIERKDVGGTCVNTGCTPTKTMIGSAYVAYQARRAHEYGVQTGVVSVDIQAVIARKNQVVAQFRQGSEKSVEKAENLDLLRGEACFEDAHTLSIALPDGSTRQLTAEHIIIDTGTRTAIPEIAGLDQIRYLDHASIMEIETLPSHLIILGGGYIGVEFAQMFRRFGCEVSLIQRGEFLLPLEDEDISQAVADIFSEDGITLYLNSQLTSVAQRGKELHLTLQSGEKITGSHLLLAAGRQPNIEALNLGAAGIQTDKKGFIQVNERLETSVEQVYAIGDVTGEPAFTHISYDDYRILRSNLLEGGAASTSGRMIPYTVFIDPQLGRVGLTEKEARKKGQKYQLASLPMSRVARATESGETRGLMKVLVETENQQILGAAILGKEGGEIMSMLQIAMMGKLPYSVLKDGIFAHPTLAEALNNLFSNIGK